MYSHMNSLEFRRSAESDIDETFTHGIIIN